MRKILALSAFLFVLFGLLILPAFSNQPVKIFVNGTQVYSDVAPFIVDGRVMVPLRFVSEALGCRVDWNGNTRSVHIAKNEPPRDRLTAKISAIGGSDEFRKRAAEAIFKDEATGYQEFPAKVIISQDGKYVIVTDEGQSATGNEYSRGYNEGYEKGRLDGLNEAQSSSYSSGYNEGYNKGYNEGYNIGYSDGSRKREDNDNRPAVYGSGEVKRATEEALDLLEEKAPEYYDFVRKWVKFIDVTEIEDASGYTTHPLSMVQMIRVSSNNYPDPIWIASVLVHEATHVCQHKEGRLFYEIEAYENQKRVLVRLGAHENLIQSVEELKKGYRWSEVIRKLFS
jgi:hypothetical protein